MNPGHLGTKPECYHCAMPSTHGQTTWVLIDEGCNRVQQAKKQSINLLSVFLPNLSEWVSRSIDFSSFSSTTKNKIHNQFGFYSLIAFLLFFQITSCSGGWHCTEVAFALHTQMSLVQFSAFPRFFQNFLMLLRFNDSAPLREWTVQSFMVVQTHLVLVSGKLVLQKIPSCSSSAFVHRWLG